MGPISGNKPSSNTFSEKGKIVYKLLFTDKKRKKYDELKYNRETKDETNWKKFKN